MLHTTIDEVKGDLPIDSINLAKMPPADYYALGHIHINFEKEINGKPAIYSGPLFPNNFAELEKLKRGGFFIVENEKPEWHPIQIYNVHSIHLDCHHKTPEQIKHDLIKEIKDQEFNETIVTIRLQGTLEAGKPSDIDWKEIFTMLYDKAAYYVMKSTTKLVTKEFEEIKIETKPTEQLENDLIKEHLQQMKIFDAKKEESLTKSLIKILSQERLEGEKVIDFEKRIKKDIEKELNLE